jgi:hypothetical protein
VVKGVTSRSLLGSYRHLAELDHIGSPCVASKLLLMDVRGCLGGIDVGKEEDEWTKTLCW